MGKQVKPYIFALLALSFMLSACNAQKVKPSLFPGEKNSSATVELIEEYVCFLNSKDYERYKEIFIGTAADEMEYFFVQGGDGWILETISAELLDYVELPDEIYRQVCAKGTQPIVYEQEKGYVLKLDYHMTEEMIFNTVNGVNYERIQLVYVDGAWKIERIVLEDMTGLQDYYEVPADRFDVNTKAPANATP